MRINAKCGGSSGLWKGGITKLRRMPSERTQRASILLLNNKGIFLNSFAFPLYLVKTDIFEPDSACSKHSEKRLDVIQFEMSVINNIEDLDEVFFVDDRLDTILKFEDAGIKCMWFTEYKTKESQEKWIRHNREPKLKGGNKELIEYLKKNI